MILILRVKFTINKFISAEAGSDSPAVHNVTLFSAPHNVTLSKKSFFSIQDAAQLQSLPKIPPQPDSITNKPMSIKELIAKVTHNPEPKPTVDLSVGIFGCENNIKRTLPCQATNNNNNNEEAKEFKPILEMPSLSGPQLTKIKLEPVEEDESIKADAQRYIEMAANSNGYLNNLAMTMSVAPSGATVKKVHSSDLKRPHSYLTKFRAKPPTGPSSKSLASTPKVPEEIRCDVCNKKMRSQMALSNHMKIHTGDKYFSCETCGKDFSCSSNLNQHMLTHTKTRPFKCGQCDAAFNHKNTLMMHMLKHSGMRPYRCDICNKGFLCQHNLTNHLRIHTGEQPFSCEFCDKRFSQNCSLQRHLMIHRGERPYICDLCGKDFNQKIHLKKHFHVHHSGHTPRSLEKIIVNKDGSEENTNVEGVMDLIGLTEGLDTAATMETDICLESGIASDGTTIKIEPL